MYIYSGIKSLITERNGKHYLEHAGTLFLFCRKSTENEEFYSRKKSSTDDDQGGVNAGLESKCSVSAIVLKFCGYVIMM